MTPSFLHRKKPTKQQETNQAAQHAAAKVSAQIAEPVLHVARWAMLVALAAFLLAATALGVALRR